MDSKLRNTAAIGYLNILSTESRVSLLENETRPVSAVERFNLVPSVVERLVALVFLSGTG
jgi:hypothetical protein